MQRCHLRLRSDFHPGPLKIEIVRMMWQVVFSDDKNHELEDNIVWRVAELIGVSPRNRMLERQRVRDAHGLPTANDAG